MLLFCEDVLCEGVVTEREGVVDLLVDWVVRTDCTLLVLVSVCKDLFVVDVRVVELVRVLFIVLEVLFVPLCTDELLVLLVVFLLMVEVVLVVLVDVPLEEFTVRVGVVCLICVLLLEGVVTDLFIVVLVLVCLLSSSLLNSSEGFNFTSFSSDDLPVITLPF